MVCTENASGIKEGNIGWSKQKGFEKMELKDIKLRILFIQHLLYTLYIHYLQAIQYYRVSSLITFMS